MKRYNGHTKYELKSGKIVVGTTTVLKILNLPALVPWANKLGLDNIVVGRYVDELADIGSLTHYRISCDVKGIPPDSETIKDYSENQQSASYICYKKFQDWTHEVNFEPILSEVKLVSEKYQYGGTIDLYCMRHGKKTLIDFKTGNRIYSEGFTQISAYKNLLEENGHEVEDQRIVRIGRTENEGFEDRYSPNPTLHFKRFLGCLEIYRINKELGI